MLRVCVLFILTLFSASVVALPLEAALTQVSAEAGADKDVAFIVAIEDYDRAPDIPGARANARLWRQWFRARGTRDVQVVEDGDASHGWARDGTPQGLLPQLEAAARRARRQGGVLWFVFIGHGAPIFDRGRIQGTLLTHGVQQTVASLRTHGILVDGDLMPRLARARQSVAVLDACFSGQSSAGPLVHGLQPLIPARMQPSKAVTVLTAAKDTQFAGPLPGANRPAFSYLLLGALAGWADGEVDRKRDRQVTTEEAFEWVKQRMASTIRGRRQTPTLRGPHRTLSRAWSAMPVARPVPPVQPVSKAKAPPRRTAQEPSSGRLLAHANRHRPALRLIPPGAFTFGSPPHEVGRFTDEHQVNISFTAPFAMMETEVTQAQWTAVMRSQPAAFRSSGDGPVEQVSWFDAVTYANALSTAERRTPCYVLTQCQGTLGTGCPRSARPRSACRSDYQCTVQPQATCTGYQLPAEAQWEYAARAGTREARHGRLDAVAWHDDNADGQPHTVGRKAANQWGLRDMLGNVAEWTNDPYLKVYRPRGRRPGRSDRARTVRGGSYWLSGRWARSAHRELEAPTERSKTIGFRLMRAVQVSEVLPR